MATSFCDSKTHENLKYLWNVDYGSTENQSCVRNQAQGVICFGIAVFSFHYNISFK